MRVRVYDKERKRYFKSEVYAIVNTGYYEKLLVMTPKDMGSNFRFYDYLDKVDNCTEVLINLIVIDRPSQWIYKKSESVELTFKAYKEFLNAAIKFYEYRGFSWLWNDKDTLVSLLKGESIPLVGSIFENKLYCDIGDSDWHYIESQEDIDSLMDQTGHFHDSVIKEISYSSGGYVDSYKSMGTTNLKKLMIKIDSQMRHQIEMTFEGLIAMNLRPPRDHYIGNLTGASLYLRDETFFFFDDEVQKVDTDYDGTWVCAYGLKWRFIISQ